MVISVRMLVGLYPFQDSGKNNQHDRIDRGKRPDEPNLSSGFPVIAVHGDDEKGDIHGNKNRERTPPWINPYEGGCLGKEDFKYREKRCRADTDQQPVADAENFVSRIFVQELAVHKPGSGKHDADFRAYADQQQKTCAFRDCPQGMTAEMLDQGIDDFIKLVNHIEG